MLDNQSTPEHLRELRQRLGCTRTDLCRWLGIGQQTHANWEHGRVPVPVYIYRLLQFVRMGLLDGTEELPGMQIRMYIATRSDKDLRDEYHQLNTLTMKGIETPAKNIYIRNLIEDELRLRKGTHKLFRPFRGLHVLKKCSCRKGTPCLVARYDSGTMTTEDAISEARAAYSATRTNPD